MLLVDCGGISVAGGLMLLASSRGFGAIIEPLEGNAVALMTLARAHLLLREIIGPRTLLGAALFLAGLLVAGGPRG